MIAEKLKVLFSFVNFLWSFGRLGDRSQVC